jgi:replicative DNA helicase
LKAVEPDYPMPNETDKLAKYEEWNAKYAAAAGKAEVIVAKQRHGATGKVKLRFDSRITKFSDLADEAYLPEMRS